MKTRALALAMLALLGMSAGRAQGAPAAAHGAPSAVHGEPVPVHGEPTAMHRAPSSPPLVSAETGADDVVGEEGAGETPQAQVDPLVSNGLGSPTCKGEMAGQLSATNRRNCETSGFVAAPAPTGDYGIDVHINTGLLGLGSGTALSFVQDLVITPLWMALVWAVHALVVMLEWCFTIDLLDGGTAVGVGRGLRAMQAAFTEPWLPVALATTSVLVLYHGLIRRRVADTLGEAVLMGAMMLAGVWVITDPTGTVGALGEWANEASLGTLAVASRGTPAGAGGALGTSLEGIFSSAIEAPWCYLEFGNVAWCREPSRLDPSLRAAGLKIAAHEITQTACQPSSALLGECTVPSSAQTQALEHSAELLRDARTNGAIFLALPANGPARNSINEQGSLLRTLCQSSEATNCRGPTAAQAEFRTDGGTWSRLGGLLLITAGLLGMLLLLGFLALRLLAAAIFSLLYLLLAPAMVLAPAFGESGRALFRRWAAQLLGAVVSKLVFSFLLGAMFAVLAILSGLNALGWWTQWLLMSAFWWGAYTRRHHALGAAGGALGGIADAGARASRRTIARRVSEVFETPRMGIAAARWAKARLSRPAPEGQARKPARVGRERARAGVDERAMRMSDGEQRDAAVRAEDAAAISGRLDAGRAQRGRIERERAAALARGEGRRAAELGHREARVQGEIEREQHALNAARGMAGARGRVPRAAGHAQTREQQERFLDAQLALPSSARARRGDERRDYAALSQLAGHGREEYERLDPRRQRQARLQIDRQLALHRERTAPGSRLASGRAEDRSTPERANAETESSVMRDAREVAARRKRQLGRDRP